MKNKAVQYESHLVDRKFTRLPTDLPTDRRTLIQSLRHDSKCANFNLILTASVPCPTGRSRIEKVGCLSQEEGFEDDVCETGAGDRLHPGRATLQTVDYLGRNKGDDAPSRPKIC